MLLIRHALCDAVGQYIAGRAAGISLNAAGRRQAHLLAERLPSDDLAAIYASPLERARETAAPLAARLGLDIAPLEALQEIDFGDWTGRTLRELDHDPRWRRWNARRGSARAPAGESMLEVQARVVGALEELRCRHPDGACAVVSHGDVIRAALLHYAGMPLDNILRITVDPASVSILQPGDDGVVIAAINRVYAA